MPSALPPILVVSLERAGDRRAFVERTFRDADLPFEIVPAVDAQELSSADIARYSSRRAMYEYGRELSRGVLACSLSHLRALQRVVDERLPEVVVFEDDTRPLPAFADILKARDSFPAGWDIVTFHSLFEGASAVPLPQEPLVGEFRLCRYRRTPMGTQAYLITNRAAKRVLEVADPIGLPADEILFRARPAALDVYGVDPAPVVHEDFPSEIQIAAPPVAAHGPATRAGLELVRVAGKARHRLQKLRVDRGGTRIMSLG